MTKEQFESYFAFGKKEEQEVEDAVIVGAEPAETVDAPSKTS
nr:MAG TPA: hypothetical protein [Caudoviricetes sp.]